MPANLIVMNNFITHQNITQHYFIISHMAKNNDSTKHIKLNLKAISPKYTYMLQQEVDNFY